MSVTIRGFVRFGCALAFCVGAARLQGDADPFPPGIYSVNSGSLSFGEGCQPLSMVHGTLTASCLNPFGARPTTTLPNADQCVKNGFQIWDVNGSLRCVIRWSPVGGSYPYVADIVSESGEVKTSAGETRVIRIDQPRVDVPQDEIPSITFRPGDKITIAAGGCVQTGGSGSTWKSYVYPTGSSADVLYSGELWIPGVTGGGLQRIAGVVNRSFPPVSGDLPPQVARSLFLHLGYQDDGYGDNGYYAHDNGNNNQCANVGPAWIEITVFTPAKPAPAPVGVQWAPWSRPFDLTWDVNVPGDDNGLPLNPQWGYQVDHPGGRPDFATTCGSAISGGDNFDDSTLQRICTTQLPTADIYTGVFRGIRGLCTGLIDGHLNWALGTYVGHVQYSGYSGSGVYGDDDQNFSLDTTNNVVETAQHEGNDPGVGLEFNSGETTDNFVSPWWSGFRNDDANEKAAAVDGDLAVVTGLVGIDGVHGGYSEIHPVFAMALLTKETPSGDGLDETWDFFIRTAGNEGGCGELTHQWPGLSGGYAIQVPWPDDATNVGVVASGTEFWVESPNMHGPTFEGQAPWTFLEFQLPPGLTDAEEGQFTLHYTLKASGKKVVPRRTFARIEPHLEDDDSLALTSSGLTDEASKAAFVAELQAALPPVIPHPHTLRVPFDTHIAAHVGHPEGFRVDRLTHDKTVVDPAKVAEDVRLRAIFEKYKRSFNVTQ